MRRFIFLGLVLVLSACGESTSSNNGNNGDNNGNNNGTSGSNNGTAGTNNGTGGTNNGTTGNNNGTAGTNNGTAGTNNGTGGTNNGTGDIQASAAIDNINPVIDGTIEVTMTFQNFTLATEVGGANVAGEGHYAVFLDTIDADQELLRTVDNPSTVTMTLANADVVAGAANLLIEVYQNDMTPYDNPVIITIPITIMDN